MLRKSSMFPAWTIPHDHLTVQKGRVYDWGIAISLQYSKTIRCQERCTVICLPWHRDNRLCSARALLKSTSAAGCSSPDHFMLSYLHMGVRVQMTYNLFTRMLANTLRSLGLAEGAYSGHSF